jgi:D-alanyl-D-alanine carboxypeptidase (penicillin-binding protein 5/6)
MRGHTRFAGRIAGVMAGLLAVAAIAAPAAQAAQAAPTVQAVQAAAGPIGVNAPSAELVNATTGKVLWSRAANTELPMGSITKVMTAYVVLEAGNLNRLITVPRGIVSYDYGASTAGLIPGEKYTALQLLYAMLIPSGCDAAYTLANAYGPGLGKFIAKMNSTAWKLGLGRIHFTDPSGLPYPTGYSTYSTARDLISLGRDAMKLPVFRQIVGLRNYHLAASGTHRAHTWTNYNSLLRTYPGAIGIKTGQTPAAGACVLFEARRGATVLIGVVLHSSAWQNLNVALGDATKMLNWGFKQ